MAWRVVATATYSTAGTTSTVTSNINSAIASVNSALPAGGRFSPGVTNPTSTSVTVSYDVPTEADAKTLASNVHSQFTTTNRVNLMVGMYNMGGVS